MEYATSMYCLMYLWKVLSLSMYCLIYATSYLWYCLIYAKSYIYDIVPSIIVLSKYFLVYEKFYLSIFLSLKKSYLCIFLSMKSPIYVFSGLWKVLSMYFLVYEKSYLWDCILWNVCLRNVCEMFQRSNYPLRFIEV